MKKIIRIEGMHCSHCVSRVEKALAALGLDVSVDIKGGIAEVTADVLPADGVLRESVEDLGFDVLTIE